MVTLQERAHELEQEIDLCVEQLGKKILHPVSHAKYLLTREHDMIERAQIDIAYPEFRTPGRQVEDYDHWQEVLVLSRREVS